MAADPLLPSLVAVIVAAPAATPVTNPLAETVATPAAVVDQVTNRPASVLPAASWSAAASCCAPPAEMLAVAGLTSTVATGANAPGRVVPLTTLDNAPKTAAPPSTPRIATSWN